MFCPNCKLEYVDGITECPDCKVPLVESLEEPDMIEAFEEEDEEVMDETMEEVVQSLGENADEEEILAMYARQLALSKMSEYKPKSDMLAENRSGAFALILCGAVGGIVLILNALKIIKLPVSGFSLTLIYAVMGCLFFVFFMSGIRSAIKVKTLKPEVEKEKENIDKVLDFIKEKKESGAYSFSVPEDCEDEESFKAENYLNVCAAAVKDVEENFTDLEAGFAYYVVDRFAGDILDED